MKPINSYSQIAFIMKVEYSQGKLKPRLKTVVKNIKKHTHSTETQDVRKDNSTDRLETLVSQIFYFLIEIHFPLFLYTL